MSSRSAWCRLVSPWSGAAVQHRSRRPLLRRCLCATLLAGAPAARVSALDYPIAIHRGNGLANVFTKLGNGRHVTIVYIGGSVTQGWGWRDLTTQWFTSRYPGQITEVNSGWGGTGSLIGAMRYARDVLAHGPDLVFIEFAVNDLPEDPLLFVERNCEGMARQTWLQDDSTDICFIETIAWYSEGPYLAGYYPTPVQAHYNVCDHYGLPSVNVGWALYEHVLAGTSWQSLTIDGDGVHPNAAGSQIYANAVIPYLEAELARSGTPAPRTLPLPMTDYPVTGSQRTELAAVSPLPSGWLVRHNQYGAASLIESGTAGATISSSFDGPAAALKVVAGPDGGDVSISIDGGPFVAANIVHLDFYSIWALPIAKMLSFAAHALTIRVDRGVVRLIEVESALSSSGPSPEDVNLALTAATTEADSVYGPGFEAANVHDGSLTTKWNSTDATQQHWLALDLGEWAQVTAFVVRHAGAAGELREFNTEAFTIESGPAMTGPWSVEFTGSNSAQLNTSLFTCPAPRLMRYVRLSISDPGIDRYARIYEFEVWGRIAPVPGDFDGDRDVDMTDFGRFQACFGFGFEPMDMACGDADLDSDADVDVHDLTKFTRCMTRQGTPGDVLCSQ